MSIWTHVAGVARVDDLRLGSSEDEVRKINEYFDKIFGKVLKYEDSSENWDYAESHESEYMPMGSEGSLIKSVWINPERDHVAAYTVSVFGDLRDYDEPEKIIEWFTEACSKCAIRNAIITAECERGKSLTWTWSHKEEESNE